MLSSLASLLDSFRIPNRRRRGFSIFSRRRRRQTSSLRCQGIPGLSLQETLAHEPLEQRRLLAVDVSLAGSVLTVSFDDASDDAVSVAITSEGYDSSGANVSSGTGTITQLVVQDSGTAQTSNFTLSEVGQVLSGGLSIGPVITTTVITTDSVNTGGGDVLVESGELTLDANIVSGEGSQIYNAAVVLASDVNLTTSTGVSGDLQVVFQGTVDSDDSATPRTLNVHSEAIFFYDDVGSQSPLNDFVGYTVNDAAERGQFYSSVTTDGLQSYKAGSSSGDIEFNGTYTAGGDIELLGEGTFGVVLSLAGDTNIDVGTGAFSVQKGSSNTYPGGNIVSQGKSESYDLTITAGNITVPAGVGVVSAGSSLSSPELKDFTINGIGTVGLNTPEVITTGDFTANPAIKIYQDTTLLSGDGEINLSSGVNNGSKSLTLGDSAQTGSIFVGGLQVRHLEVGNGAFDVTLDGAMHLATNLSAPTKFLNTGSLTLIGQGSSFFGGVEALSVSQTNIAGCVSTFGGDINLNNVMMLDSTYAARFDTRWTQTQGGTAGGGDITISNFNTGNLNATKSVEFDIGNGTPNTVSLTGNIVSNNELRFKGIGAVNVSGEANLAGGVHAQNLSFETDTIPSLNFTGNVTLTGPMEFEGTSATFANGVEGGDNDLTLNFSQTATVDGYSNVANFTSEGAVNLSGNFTTTGFQKYEGNVALGGDTELAATTVEFTDGVTGNYHNLTLSPSDSFIKLDGIQLSGVENLTIGGDLNLSGSLSAGDIDIQGNTTLIGDADLTSELVSCLSSRQIILNGAVDGAHALTVNGTTDFRGEIGGTTPLASLTTEGGESSPYFCTTLGANVTTTGDQTFGTPVTITSDTTFSGGNLSLARIIGGGPTFDRNVEFDFADTTIRNAYGGPQFINIVDLKVTGTSTLSGEIYTTGNQSFQGQTSLDGDTTLLSNNGTILLTGGVGGGNSGSRALTLGDSAQTGNIFIGGLQVKHLEVGNGAFDVMLDGAMHLATNLAEPTKFLNTGSLTLVGQGSSFFGGIEALGVSQTKIAGCVATFGGDISLNNVMMLDSTSAARFDTRWTQTHGGTAGGGDITISSFHTGTLNPTKSVEFDIGNGTPNTVSLTGNIVSNNQLVFKGIGSVNVSGDANLAGGVSAQNLSFETDTTPSLDFTGNVTLTGPMEFEGTSATFANGVEGGDNDLTLNFSQTATVDGYSNIANFTSEGAVNLSGNFTTTGFQKYEGNVALGGDTKLVATTVEFADGVTGNYRNLTLSPSDSFIKLDGIQLSGVENLTIDGDLNLSGNLSAGDISIQGNTTLIGDANLTSEIVSCLSSQQITLNGAVDGGYALSVNGTTDFHGEIGGTTPLASLTTEGGDTSLGGNVKTTGNQNFGSDVTLTGDTKFVSGNLFDLSGLVGGGYNVEIDAVNAIIDAQKHSVSGIADLTVPGDVGLNGSIATTGNQLYSGDVGVLGNTTLTAGSGAISLGTGGEVIGASHTLTLGDANQTGDVTLSGDVTLDGLEVGQEVGNGAFNLRVNTSQFTVTKLVDILSTGQLDITPVGNSQLNFENGLNATNPSSIYLAGAIASSQGPEGLSFGYAKVGYDSPSATLTVGGNENAVISFNTLEISGGKLNYDGPVDIGDLNITRLIGDAALDVGINGTGYFHVSGDASVTGNVSSGGNLSDGGSQFYDGNVTLTGTAGFAGKSADFQKGIAGNNNNLTLGLTEQSFVNSVNDVRNFTSSGEVVLNGSFFTYGFQNFAGGINLAANTTLHAATGFIKLDGIQGENYELTINALAPADLEADVTIEGDVSLNSLNATSGNYNVSLIGSPMKFQQVTLLNSGDVTLGQSDTTDLVVEDGIVVDKASATFVAGTIASDGAGITLHNISLNANTTIDTTNGGSNVTGAEILLKESITFNGHTLKTDGGTSDTDFRGDMTLKNGTLDVTKGSVNFGESGNSSNAANITIAEQMTINVPESGALNVFDGSQVDAGNYPINIKANTINFESTAGSFTSTNEITIVPATGGSNISVGTATGDGLDISQTTFNKMQAPNVVIGGAGYTGTITVENLNSTNSGQLTLIANGTGGAIDISGGLDLQGQDSSGISLYVKGSGATTDLSGPITTAGAAFFDDAVRLVGDTSIVTSGGDVTITGGTDGIYSQSGSSHNLSINAGAGDVVVGNQTGFGNGITESLIGKVTLDSTSSITLGEGDQEMHSLDVFNSPLELGGSLGTSLILSGGLFGGADLRTGITGNKSFLEIDLESGFVDSVKLGSITNVNNLAITEDSLSPSPLRKVEMHGDVTTIEGQSYEPNVELRNAVLLNAAGNVSIDGTLTAEDGLVIPRNVGITALGGKVSIADFGSGTTADNHYDVAILAAADVDLGGGVGSFDGTTQHGLQFLTINTITNSVNFNAASGLTIGGNLSIESSANVTIGSGAALETYGDLTINSTDISLGANVTTGLGTLTLNGTASVTDSIVLDSGSGDLTVTGALLATTNGTHDVTINSSGTAKIGGAVGNATAASDLFFANLTTDAGGTTEFNGNIFAAEQVFNDDIVLNQGTSTNLTAGGVNATFNGNVDAESSDIVLDFTTTAIDGSKWSNLAELTVNADTGGTIGLNGTITSSGSQTYNGAVQLDGDTTLIGGFALNLPQGVSGNSKNLDLNFSQPTSLAGNFTGINDLTSKGDVLISGEIRTTGNQSYDAGVTLDGVTILQGNSLSLNGVNGGGNNLDIIFNTTTAINSNWTNISDFLAVTSVSLTGNFSTQFQVYQNAVTLLGDTVLRASGTDYRGVAFDGNATIDGRHDLSIHADSTASINLAKAVGSSAPLRSLNLASAAAVEALESLTIDGTGGSGPGLRFGFAVDNINMTAAGSSISNAAQDGILFAGGSANSTLANFTVTNSGGNGITMAGGDYTNTTIRDVVVTTSGAAAVSMSDDGHGLYANNATGFTVTDSSMTLNKGSGVYVEGSVSEGVTVSNSTFGIDGEGLAAGNKGYGIGFAGGKNHVADNNTIGGNDLTGLLAVSPVTGETVSNITFRNNWIGLTRSEEPMPNGQAGIWVLGDVTDSEGYTQGFVDDVKIQGNRVENAIFNGIEIDNATNVTVGGIGSEPLKHNLIKNSNQYGLAMTGDLNGTRVRGNTLMGNFDSGLYIRDVTNATIGGGIDAAGSLVIEGSSFGVTAMGDLTGTRMTGNRIHTNANAGVFMMGAKNFDLFRNKIEDNGPYGVLAFEESTGTTISGNAIERSEAGVWLSGASGLTIGYDATGTPAELRVGNKIKDNYSVGIIIQGSTAADNRILSNEIYLNTYYGIQFVGGAAPSVRPPRLFAASLAGDTTTVTGRLNGEIGDTYLIQYFQNKPEDMQPGRAPEGQILVHSSTVVITSEGFVDIESDIVNGQEYTISAGDWITTTATVEKDGVADQTSVFSSGVRVREVPDV